VLPESQWDVIEARSGSAVIRLDEASPIVVIEVLSPSTQSTDLTDKRREYAQRDIAE
jgi:Uma2 family endonuclease